MIREALPKDAPALVRLFSLLGHELEEDDLAARVGELSTLVVERNGVVVAALGLAFAHYIHRRQPIARITILVVDDDWRGRGIGTALLEEAKARARAEGCELLELTSNARLTDAHAFYAAQGFEPTSKRFAIRL